MKKVLLLTLVLCMLVSSIAIAAPSIGAVFSVTENGKVFYYMFGSVGKTAEDVGLTINGKDYNLDAPALLKAQSSGKFGIGIADPDNILGDEFVATPYEVVGEQRQTGEEKNVVKNEVADNDVIALNSLIIDGKAVAGFYTGTTETDFYYGLDEINSASDIPEVSYTLSIGNATTSLTEETGGYVYTITASKEGRDGVEKSAQFKVHFREFAEVTEKVYPKYAYLVQCSYIGELKKLDEYTTIGSVNPLWVRSIPDIYSSNNSYLQYITYNVPAVDGYAPVYYDMENIWLGNNGMTTSSDFPVSAYAYDGEIETANLPSVINDETKGFFNGFKGFNSDSSFLINKFAKSTGARPSGITISSSSVKEGTNIVIWKSDDVTVDTDGKAKNSYRIAYHNGDSVGAEGWRMPITVKYVEKNPKDETDIDTTLSSLTINGKNADAVKDNTYYVAVEDLNNLGDMEIEAIPTYADGGATAEVSAITDNQAIVTVTAKDGVTTGKYTVIFKKSESKIMQASKEIYLVEFLYSSKLSAWKYQFGTRSHTESTEKNKHGMMSYVPVGGLTQNSDKTSPRAYVSYATFDTSELNNVTIIGEITLSGTAYNIQTYDIYQANVDDAATIKNHDIIVNGEAVKLGSAIAENTNQKISIALDSSKMTIKSGRVILALVSGTEGGDQAILFTPTLTINYITLD